MPALGGKSGHVWANEGPRGAGKCTETNVSGRMGRGGTWRHKGPIAQRHVGGRRSRTGHEYAGFM